MLVGDVGKALSSARSLQDMLDATCQAMVKHIDAAFARVWTLNEAEDVLELQASAGMYTHLDGAHARVPLGELKIGMIAQDRKPLVTNDVQSDARISDQEWARREGMVSFVGYPLMVEDSLVGIAALFARRELGPDVFDGVASVCDMIALGVSRYRAEEQRKQLYLKQRMRAAQMRAIADASLAINTAGDVHAILQVIAERAALLIGTHQSVATLFGSENEPSLRAAHLSDRYALWRAESGLPESTGVCLPVDRIPEAARLTHAELLTDERYAARERNRADRVPMRGWLAAPLLGRGNALLGLVQLSDKLAGAEFNEDDVRVLQQLAQLGAVAIENMQLTGRMAAIAMDNARLFQNAQKLIRALERSNAELDQFAYVASHDLKAPLRGISNLAQWLEEDIGENLTDSGREQLDLLKSRVQRMEGLINGILDYSRAGRTRAQPEPIESGRLLVEVIELLAAGSGAVQVGDGMPLLVTERVPLQQVFMNLIGNALKHARRSDPVVRVQAREDGFWYEFSVADNGHGIAPEFHDKIWGIFQTLEPRDVIEGTGIGLSVVKKIVESKGGRVWVESALGAGATFRFTWPKAEKGDDS